MSERTLEPMRAENMRARAETIFRECYEQNLRRTDRMFAYLMVGQWIFGIAIALAFSPYGWEGKTRSIHLHVELALLLGAAISSLPLLLILRRPGTTLTRHSVAIAQMLWSALLIHLTGGRIETHFHVFGSLAFIAFYCDWRVLLTGSAVVALDHLVRQLVYPESVYGVANPETWRFLEHAFWVVFEDVFLVVAMLARVRDMKATAATQARIELGEQLEKEMEIAARIQTAILPSQPVVPGLEIAATMIPASEVGGDYYDVLPVDGDGCWLGIGDVAGHGLVAGLVMLQTQSAVRALVQQNPSRSPREVLADANSVVFDNVRRRLGHDHHMTLSLIRYRSDGAIVVAGAHQSIVILRAKSGRCELFRPQGTWLGLIENVLPFTEDRTFRLEPGDLLVLFTDGVTEAMSSAHEQFGLARLCEKLESLAPDSAEGVRDGLLRALAEWSTAPHADDLTLLVLRHVGTEKTERLPQRAPERQAATA